MSPAFISGLTDQFPQTQLTFDPFHVMQVLTNAIDQIRREEQPTHPELKGTRYVWLKNEWNLTAEQSKTFEQLRFSKLATVRATHMKSVFQDIMAYKRLADAEPLLKRWYFWATHSRIEPLIQAAKTIKRHWAGVLRWFVSGISNGVLEAINSLIQSAKAKARGFRNSRYLITMVYLIAGKLDFKLPDMGYPTHTKSRGGFFILSNAACRIFALSALSVAAWASLWACSRMALTCAFWSAVRSNFENGPSPPPRALAADLSAA
jgi:hypothetical protein